MEINRWIACYRKYSGRWPFVSSFRLSLCWIWAAYTTFHTLCYRKKLLIVCHKRINEFPTLCSWFKAVEIIKLCYIVPCRLNKMGFNLIDFCANLVPVWVCNIQRGPLLQHTTFKISVVRAPNAMDEMLFCCIAVFQYVSIICQCGASANAFKTRCVA